MGATPPHRHPTHTTSRTGDYQKPTPQHLGLRGPPGNTVTQPTPDWIPKHSTQVFVPKVDVVSGVGYDRAAKLGPRGSRFHEIRRVVSNLGVFDFETPDHSMRLRSVHPGSSVEEIREQTGFGLVADEPVPETRLPSDEELRLIREAIDPKGLRDREIRSS
jgi:acyl CoA:acetate/3-ketoacid CoA transferase beta subunit